MPTEEVKEGSLLSDFQLLDQNDKTVSLSSFKGQHVILYFYPKDDTPGCTKEACGFQLLHSQFKRANAVILGVSPDDSASHTRFIAKYDLPFSLLSDPDKRVMNACGAWGKKNLYGKITTGVIRSTLWIDPEGKVKKHWRRVPKAADHPQKVLELLEKEAN